ncbi:hypothetical protein Srufu_066620 [Streptomyces libani subsp. rufus]|nr:hypothetical protein Srufu_066620 [Streptomyces libani subsp. rufus]
MCNTCEPDRAMATVPAQRKVEDPPRGSCGECGCRIFLVGPALEDSLCKPCRTRQPQRQRNGPHSAKQLERQPAPVSAESHAAVSRCRPVPSRPGPGAGTLPGWGEGILMADLLGPVLAVAEVQQAGKS